MVPVILTEELHFLRQEQDEAENPHSPLQIPSVYVGVRECFPLFFINVFHPSLLKGELLLQYKDSSQP